jgi:hypothetical protein
VEVHVLLGDDLGVGQLDVQPASMRVRRPFSAFISP